jgi:hypothetical protein
MRKDRQRKHEGRRTMNDQEIDLVLGQVCVTLANLLLFGSTAAQTACFTDEPGEGAVSLSARGVAFRR